MARSLVLTSFSLRNILTLPKHVTVTRLYQSSAEVQESNMSVEKQLFLQLQKDNNPLNLISIIEENKNIINARHIIAALSSMQRFYLNSGLQFLKIHESIQFLNMCSILRRNLMTLDLHQTIQAIRVLNLLKVPANANLMQSLLQLIRISINDLSLRQINDLSHILKTMQETALRNAISRALPKLFMAQLKLQLDKNNITELRCALEYSCYHSYDEEMVDLIDYIIDAINNYKDPINIDNAVQIYFSLCKFNHLPNNYQILMNRVEEILEHHVRVLDPLKLYKILVAMSINPSQGETQSYNPQIMDQFINRFITTNPDFQKGADILNKLNKYKHINIGLLNYLASLCLQQPMTLSECRPYSIADFVSGLAYANHKPPHWEELQKIIVKCYKLIPDDVTLCYFTLNLVSLDCFDYDLLKRTFTLDINPLLVGFYYYKVLKQLYQSVKTLYPAYTGPWPSESLIQHYKNLNSKEENMNSYTLKYEIENIVGDPAYVHTNILTSLGHTIDYLIILQNGNPIVVKSKSSSRNSTIIPSVDDLDIPPDAERVAVIRITDRSHGRNIPIIDSRTMLNIKSLAAMSFKVVPVSIRQWRDIPDREKLPYLKRLIYGT